MMKVYAVRRGRKTGLFYDYDECMDSVFGYSGQEFRRFNSENAAYAYLNEYDDDDSSESGPDFGTGVVYADGACSNNQNPRYASAGVGVFWGQNSSRNISRSLIGNKQTNARAELMAVKVALEGILHFAEDDNIKYSIATDSKYAAYCSTSWGRNWEENGYFTNNGERVGNQDLVRACVQRVRLVNELYDELGWGRFNFLWTKGHRGVYGNEMADAYARMGCER